MKKTFKCPVCLKWFMFKCFQCDMAKTWGEVEYSNYVDSLIKAREDKIKEDSRITAGRQKRALNKLLGLNKYNKYNKKPVEQEIINNQRFDKVTCSKCNIIKYRIRIEGDYKTTYRDENGNCWECRVCPICLKIKNDLRNKKNRVNLNETSCLICNKIFKPNSSSNKFCSKDCRKISINLKNKKKCQTCDILLDGKKICRKCNPIKPKESKIHQCLQCNIDTNNKKYCSKKCKRKHYKKIGKIKRSPNTKHYNRFKKKTYQIC